MSSKTSGQSDIGSIAVSLRLVSSCCRHQRRRLASRLVARLVSKVGDRRLLKFSNSDCRVVKANSRRRFMINSTIIGEWAGLKSYTMVISVLTLIGGVVTTRFALRELIESEFSSPCWLDSYRPAPISGAHW